MIKTSIGIDISQEKLDVYWSKADEYSQYSNDQKGQKKLVKYLSSIKPDIIIYEPTNKFHLELERKLHEFGFKIYRVAPLRLRNFARGLNQKAKTDKLDAKVLALFGLKNELNPSMVPSETMNQLKETYGLMQKLVQMRTEMQLRWQSMRFSNTQNSCKDLTKHIDIEIAECENKILEIIKSDDILWQHYEIIVSIKGVGKKCTI